LMVLTVTYIRIDGSESFQQDQCNVSDFLVTSYSLNSCTNVVAENCTKIYDAGCGPWIDNGVDVGTYCCLSTQDNVPISGGKSVCCQYGTASPHYVKTNSQCTDSQSAYTHGTHCASYCEYYMGTGVTIGENNMDSYGRSCKITSDRRLVRSLSISFTLSFTLIHPPTGHVDSSKSRCRRLDHSKLRSCRNM